MGGKREAHRLTSVLLAATLQKEENDKELHFTERNIHQQQKLRGYAAYTRDRMHRFWYGIRAKLDVALLPERKGYVITMP